MKNSDVIDIIKKNIHSDLQSNHIVATACLAIIDHLMTTKPPVNSNMSTGFLSTVIRHKAEQLITNDEQVLEAATYLISGKARLLDMILTYEDPHSDFRHELTFEEEKKVVQHNQFNHPLTDEPVEDFVDYLFISFKRSQLAVDEYYKRFPQAA